MSFTLVIRRCRFPTGGTDFLRDVHTDFFGAVVTNILRVADFQGETSGIPDSLGLADFFEHFRKPMSGPTVSADGALVVPLVGPALPETCCFKYTHG